MIRDVNEGGLVGDGMGGALVILTEEDRSAITILAQKWKI
jgi:hypothetical protein